jgi:hypothetical protein
MAGVSPTRMRAMLDAEGFKPSSYDIETGLPTMPKELVLKAIKKMVKHDSVAEPIKPQTKFDYELCKQFLRQGMTLTPQSKMWDITINPVGEFK